MSGHQHELFMMALTAVLSVIVGILAGRIWEAWRAIEEEPELSRHEIAMINADRLRRRRDESTPRKTAFSAHMLRTVTAAPKRKAATIH